jgi:hypothetical protein
MSIDAKTGLPRPPQAKCSSAGLPDRGRRNAVGDRSKWRQLASKTIRPAKAPYRCKKQFAGFELRRIGRMKINISNYLIF